MSDKPYEFDCIDCGRHVVAWGNLGPDLTRCTTCFWIAENVPQEEQLHVRATLGSTPLAPEVRDYNDIDFNTIHNLGGEED